MKWYEILWQFPQWLIGKVYLASHYRDVWNILKYNGATYYIIDGQKNSVAFCKDYVFLSKFAQHSTYTIKHEYGHIVQSQWLGWLYPIIIGIPSLLWAWIHGHPLRGTRYYDFPTEAWANWLGGNR